jgi:RNA polymerase sigma factor for flagellar operon FliA
MTHALAPNEMLPGAADDGNAELLLWRRWRCDGDEKARQALLQTHLPFARIMAGKLYAGRIHDAFEFEEYLQMATVALIESIDRYDPARGAQFRTFAHYRIHGAILTGLERMSERQQQISLQKRLKADRLSLATEATAPTKGNADQLFLYLAEVGIGLALGAILGDNDQGESEEEWAPDQSYDRVELKQFASRLRHLMDQLTERERQVIRGHYLQSMTFEEVASQLGISKARVSQLHYQGLQRMRKQLTSSEQCNVAW